MGFFGFLGKVGKGALGVVKGVGITAGNVAGGVVGLDGLGSTINASLSKNNATAGAATAAVDGSAAPMTSQATVTAPAGGLLGAVTGALYSFSDWVGGKSRPQVDVNTGIGGRLNDKSSSSGLPSWLPIAGLAAGGLLLFTSMSGKRR